MNRSGLLRIAAVATLGGGGITTLAVYLIAPSVGIPRGLVYLVLLLGSLLAIPVLWGATDLAYDSGLGTNEGFALTDSEADPNVDAGLLANRFVLGLYCVGIATGSLGMLLVLTGG